jgi:uncharacterized pyridoxamine 5'-phosphate oxidase family protein
MNEVVKFLTENPVQYVATVGLDGKPSVRPFQFMGEHSGKLYYCTNNQKNVFKQIQMQPYIEISTSSPTDAWIRLSGKVVFSKDKDIKKKVIEGNPLLKKLYQSADNPVFEIFYLEEATAVINDFSGYPPRNFIL